MSVHENIRRVREAKGVSKTHIAKGLGLSLQGYCHIESGAVKLDVDRLQKIGTLLSVDGTIFFNDKLTDSVIKKANG